MKKIFFLIIIIALAILAIYGYYFSTHKHSIHNQLPVKKGGKEMILKSGAFENNRLIPALYTCDGQDINPDFYISGVPKEAKSLTLIVDDPDSPSGTFTHWLLFNISPAITVIKENSIPEGSMQGINDFGHVHYGGPCPGTGSHHYVFTLYALDQKLNVKEGAGKTDLLKAMSGHILSQTELIGLYKRE